ncbi:sigma-70 family RNA polymerase sigma factor [Flavivirga amylovorans]|uniref:Sigma-70 family RNA polymerase sigma factor n=1 Tax=Flavivirga amylovorans TaxID=870486 RepID=A0ABT8WZH7_9FLAO|nr:sigma-70 family RNA polymerase sigma factor [Flavivirga amylovorans]MDO5987042.1 sigma-70 family RNA polymerase sigma factor [Flavivirga amylovorans]
MKDSNSVCLEHNYRKVFDNHSEELRNYLYYRCGDLQQAEDIVQDSFIKLWNNCKKVLLEKARGYLYAISKNAFYNEVAHKKVILKYAKQPQKISDIETPEYKMEEDEFMVKLENAIQSLPEGQREVFLLNRVDKKTYKEMAEMLGVSQKAIEKRMHKALIKLRLTIKNI